MSELNVFRNHYAAAENRLTYDFLCMLDLMADGQAAFVQFLIGGREIELSEKPVDQIRPLFAFAKAPNPGEEASNPDGCVRLRRKDGGIVPIFLEVKTHRCLLTADQLQRHLVCHVDREPGALLLAITPRPSDRKVVQALNDNRVIFVSWQQIADHLAATRLTVSDRKIANQFLNHAREEREFMQTELEKEDISLIIANHRRRPDLRARGAFDLLMAEFPFERYVHLQDEPYDAKGRWGCRGLDLPIDARDEAMLRWMQFGIYDGSEVSLIDDMPELALFIDAGPKLKASLKLPEFLEAIRKLEALGWEENLTKQNSPNAMRLLWWRQPLDQVREINSGALAGVLEQRLRELVNEPRFVQHYLRV